MPDVQRRGRLAPMSPKRGSSVLVTVLFTDIVGSTEIAAELGIRDGGTSSGGTTRSCGAS
jgi:class 3 adenylate cyclase